MVSNEADIKYSHIFKITIPWHLLERHRLNISLWYIHLTRWCDSNSCTSMIWDQIILRSSLVMPVECWKLLSWLEMKLIHEFDVVNPTWFISIFQLWPNRHFVLQILSYFKNHLTVTVQFFTYPFCFPMCWSLKRTNISELEKFSDVPDHLETCGMDPKNIQPVELEKI